MSRSGGPRGRGYGERTTGTREPIQRFLIVCEGEKTEPNYFKKFRVPADVRVDVRGLGANTVSLVRRTVALRDAGDYDQTWCVFDRDSFPARTFNAALALAKQERIGVAYSNEAFELWYLLHFDYFDTGISRAAYGDKLSTRLGARYAKNSESMFAALWPMQATAIANAERLLNSYRPRRPADDNPSTTVHLLVQALRRFER
jgi:hypothetical protein